jgi:hemerythrin
MEKINFQDMSFDATHQAIIAIVNEKSEFLSDQQIKDAQYDILELALT